MITSHSQQYSSASTHATLPVDDLAKVFNTALVGHHAEKNTQEGRDFSVELQKVMETAEFRAILAAIRQFAKLQGTSEKEAAQRILQTFFKMNDIWSSYLTQEGLERLKSSR